MRSARCGPEQHIAAGKAIVRTDEHKTARSGFEEGTGEQTAQTKARIKTTKPNQKTLRSGLTDHPEGCLLNTFVQLRRFRSRFSFFRAVEWSKVQKHASAALR